MIVVKLYANKKFIGYKRGTYLWDYRLDIVGAQMYKETEIESIKKEMEYLFNDVDIEGYTLEYRIVKCYIIESDEEINITDK